MVAALDADESWRGGTTAACDCCGNLSTKLSAAQASEHSLLPSFWEVVDYVLAADPLVHSHHCDHEPES